MEPSSQENTTFKSFYFALQIGAHFTVPLYAAWIKPTYADMPSKSISQNLSQ